MTKLILAGIGCAAVVGCAAPQHDQLRVTERGQIAPTAVGAFADCMADGWKAEQPALSQVRIEESRRAEGMRIDKMAYSFTAASADAFDDGRVELRTGTPTNGGGKVFDACLSRFAAK